jgi:redox-sensing transcriptional repressor
MTNILVSCGIKAIWNFAHTDLNVPKDVVVENVHLFDSLMRLSYNLSSYEKE